MKQYVLKLSRVYTRPVVVLNNGLKALVDTGACIPVWTDEEEILVTKMGARSENKKVPLSGFGGITYGNLYKVTLDIGGILYPDMHIVANRNLKASFNMILNATMFKGLIYEINDWDHILKITLPDKESNIRNLKVTDSKGKLRVMCQSANDDDCIEEMNSF